MPNRSPATKVFKLLDLKISRLVDNLFIGNYKTAFKGQGIEFGDLRLYEPGDDVRSIDWTTSAKQGKIYVKKFIEERQLTIFFLLDIGESMNFGLEGKTKYETAIETFYTLAFSSIKNNDKIGALIYADTIHHFFQPQKGKAQIFQIIKALENNSHNNNSNTISALEYIYKLKYKNCLIFVLSDDIYTQLDPIFKLCAQKNEIIYLNIFDARENNLTKIPYHLQLSQNNSNLQINLQDKKKLGNYQLLRANKLKAFQKNLNQIGIDYIYLDNHKNILQELFKYFKSK